jgi:hypothetical protein
MHHSRRFLTATLIAAALVALGCESPVQPSATAELGTASHARSPIGQLHSMSVGATEASANAPGQLVACQNHDTQVGSALIGPSGGTLVVGNSRLIVPAGALTEPTQISGTIPDTTIAIIEFEPTGLRFNKPAGLQLDVSGCDPAASESPAVDYVDDAGNVQEWIEAVFSNDWHTVAAPIDHFSGYAFAF